MNVVGCKKDGTTSSNTEEGPAPASYHVVVLSKHSVVCSLVAATVIGLFLGCHCRNSSSSSSAQFWNTDDAAAGSLDYYRQPPQASSWQRNSTITTTCSHTRMEYCGGYDPPSRRLFETTSETFWTEYKSSEYNNDDDVEDSSDDEDDSDDDEDDSDDDDDVMVSSDSDPVGQHLSVDIIEMGSTATTTSSSPQFRSKQGLQRAILKLVETMDDAGALIAHHCHDLQQSSSSSGAGGGAGAGGATCTAILEDCHVTLYSMPTFGVILLDVVVFQETTHGLASKMLPMIENAFTTTAPIGGGEEQESPNPPPSPPPRMMWSDRRRGFSTGAKAFLEGDIRDLSERRDMVLKEEIATVQSQYQSIAIYDTIDTRRYYQSQQYHPPTKQQQQHHRHVVDRRVFLDGVIQSRRFGESYYHEALVHPAMFSHDRPRRVAIIGGGEGATLREVLKHATVETVTMIEIDEIMVNVSRDHLSEWSDCSDLVGSATTSCFDDPRVELYFIDAISWFIDHFSNIDQVDDSLVYDVIIMDALDPSSLVEFSDVMYGNEALVHAISNAVGDHGIFVVQLGEEDHADELPSEYDDESLLVDRFYESFVAAGFQFIKDYSEAQGGFEDVWSFMIAVKDRTSTVQNWYMNEAQMNLKIHQRAMKTVSGESPFRYFDGATMMSLQYPSRVIEESYCFNTTVPALCEHGHGFNPEIENAAAAPAPVPAAMVSSSSSSLQVKGINDTYNKDDGVSSSSSSSSYLSIDESVQALVIPPSSHDLIRTMATLVQEENAAISRALEKWPNGYIFSTNYYGGNSMSVLIPAAAASPLLFSSRHSSWSSSSSWSWCGTTNGTSSSILATGRAAVSTTTTNETEEESSSAAASSSNCTQQQRQQWWKLLHSHSHRSNNIVFDAKPYVYNPYLDRNHWTYLYGIDRVMIMTAIHKDDADTTAAPAAAAPAGTDEVNDVVIVDSRHPNHHRLTAAKPRVVSLSDWEKAQVELLRGLCPKKSAGGPVSFVE